MSTATDFAGAAERARKEARARVREMFLAFATSFNKTVKDHPEKVERYVDVLAEIDADDLAACIHLPERELSRHDRPVGSMPTGAPDQVSHPSRPRYLLPGCVRVVCRRRRGGPARHRDVSVPVQNYSSRELPVIARRIPAPSI